MDHGLLRKDEGDQVEQVMKHQFHVDVRRVNAGPRFLGKLAGVTEPERKRKIIGEEFIRVFEEEAKKIGAVDFLAQGTIYPDVVESRSRRRICRHQEPPQCGRPARRTCEFKDDCRSLCAVCSRTRCAQLGTELGLPDELVWRQPFPGPGLAIRVIGEITRGKAVHSAGRRRHLPRGDRSWQAWTAPPGQFFAVLTDLRSVGVMGDERTYDYTLALRAVQSQDFMTATWSRLPYELLDKVSGRIVGEVKHINRICYDITSKPPATVEWE